MLGGMQISDLGSYQTRVSFGSPQGVLRSDRLETALRRGDYFGSDFIRSVGMGVKRKNGTNDAATGVCPMHRNRQVRRWRRKRR
jgi:hypothetical protein